MTETIAETGPATGAEGEWSLSRPSTRRSLLLAALGAFIGLAVAGVGLFTAQGTRTSAIPAEDIALVNGIPIARTDFITQLRQLDDVSPSEATPAQRREVLDAMIDEELAVQRGVELNMPVDDIDTRTALVAAVRGSLATDILASAPDDGELEHFFAARREHYAEKGRMELAALSLPKDPARAKAAVAALRSAAPIDRTIADYRLRSTGKVDDGEEYYFAAAIHLGARLFAVARALPTGGVSDPVDTPDGPVVLVMKRNRPPVLESFADARDQVRVDYSRERLQKAEANNARFLRSRADIALAPDKW